MAAEGKNKQLRKGVSDPNQQHDKGETPESRGPGKKGRQERSAGEKLREANIFIQNVMDCATIAIFALDLEGRFIKVNQAGLGISGYSESELLGSHYSTLIPKWELQQVDAAFRLASIKGKTMKDQRIAISHKDGRSVSVDFSIAPLVQGNAIRSVVGTAVDVTDRLKMEGYLREAATVFEHTGQGLASLDSQGRVVMVNPAYTAITGYENIEVAGRPLQALQGENGSLDEPVRLELVENGQWSGEVWDRRKDGSAVPLWVQISRVGGQGGERSEYIAFIHDNTKLLRSRKQARRMAFYDPLTGLANRLLLQDRLEQALTHAGRHNVMVGVLFVDLDDFKDVNDNYGHRAGDEVLREAARRLKGCIRSVDTAARLGGDEFVLVLNDLHGPGGARLVADKVLGRMEAPFQLGGRQIHIHASIGVSIAPANGMDAESLVHAADQAMYKAKRSGKARVSSA